MWELFPYVSPPLCWRFDSTYIVPCLPTVRQRFPAKTYGSKNSYTPQYRHFPFEWSEYGWLFYRCSGTFRQISRSNFGYFVYWFFLLICSAFSTKKQPQPLRPGPIFYSSEFIKSLQSSSRYAFSKADFGLHDSYPSGYFTRYPGRPFLSCGSAFTIFTPM